VPWFQSWQTYTLFISLSLKDTSRSRSFDTMLIFHVNYFRENSKTSIMKELPISRHIFCCHRSEVILWEFFGIPLATCLCRFFHPDRNQSKSINISLWLYSPLDLVRIFSCLILYTVDRTPWMEDQPVSMPLPTHRATQTQNKRTETSMSRVGFQLTTPVFEWAKAVHALDLAV
jgi:hypothetical protein